MTTNLSCAADELLPLDHGHFGAILADSPWQLILLEQRRNYRTKRKTS